MSWLTNELTENIKTTASLDNLEKILIQYKFKITKTSLSISATKSNWWTSNTCTIIFTDDGNYRNGSCRQVLRGLANIPKGGLLAEIVQKAEKM